jgi:hypothetical protein
LGAGNESREYAEGIVKANQLDPSSSHMLTGAVMAMEVC